MHTEASQVFYGFTVGAIVLGLILAGFIIFSFHTHRRMRRLRQEVMRQDVQILEEERNRIGQEIHDNMCSRMVMVIHLLDKMQPASATDQEMLTEAKAQMQCLMSSASQAVDRFSLRSFGKVGFVASVEELVRWMGTAGGVRCCFDHRMCRELPRTVEMHLYRIVQEIIQNTLKHAQADFFRVHLVVEEQELRLMAEDDGCGFVYRASNPEQGLGLRGIFSRVEMLGGTTQLVSVPGKGTQYFIRIRFKPNV